MVTTTKKRGSGNRRQAGRNNNPEGRNQYSGVMGTARAHPLGAAVVAGGALAASVFLLSRRDRISEQLSSLSDQISEIGEGSRPQSELAEEALTLKQLGQPNAG